MTLLIATDEAGYGPRLGPLVVVATAWRLENGFNIQTAHAKLAEPISITPIGNFRIDDSKRLFKQPARNSHPFPAPSLIDQITDAAANWVSLPLPSEAFWQWLQKVAPHDLAAVVRQPWFEDLPASNGRPSEDTSICRTLIDHWSSGGLRLIGMAVRVIDARRFNQILETAGNKADLLSDMTCSLAISEIRAHRLPGDTLAVIQSDRLGGRAYYGGLIQHHCPGSTIHVVAESPKLSCYRLDAVAPELASIDHMGAPSPLTINWSFTVGGDSYAPVAMSSIIAKSTRERLMGHFNRYFNQLAKQNSPVTGPLRPTAGYAVDAERFLADIAAIRAKQKISDRTLIRLR